MAAQDRKCLQVKAFGGRGHKRALWVTEIYKDVLTEIERLICASVKLSHAFVRVVAHSSVDIADATSAYHRSIFVLGVPSKQKITDRWVQHFMTHYNHVLRLQAGKLAVSPEKQLEVEKAIEFHLGHQKMFRRRGNT